MPRKRTKPIVENVDGNRTVRIQSVIRDYDGNGLETGQGEYINMIEWLLTQDGVETMADVVNALLAAAFVGFVDRNADVVTQTHGGMVNKEMMDMLTGLRADVERLQKGQQNAQKALSTLERTVSGMDLPERGKQALMGQIQASKADVENGFSVNAGAAQTSSGKTKSAFSLDDI